MITDYSGAECRPINEWLDNLAVQLELALGAHVFLPARRYASAVFATATCLSVRLSVCHTPVLCLAQRKQDREMYTI